MKTYQTIARAVVARQNCINSNNAFWANKWEELVLTLVKELFPSSSGFDNGTKIDFDASEGNCLVFVTAYHHMNENGVYDGWTDHNVFVRGDLAMGYAVKITGRDRNQIKEYMHECFASALDEDSTPIEIKLGLAKEVPV